MNVSMKNLSSTDQERSFPQQGVAKGAETKRARGTRWTLDLAAAPSTANPKSMAARNHKCGDSATTSIPTTTTTKNLVDAVNGMDFVVLESVGVGVVVVGRCGEVLYANKVARRDVLLSGDGGDDGVPGWTKTAVEAATSSTTSTKATSCGVEWPLVVMVRVPLADGGARRIAVAVAPMAGPMAGPMDALMLTLVSLCGCQDTQPQPVTSPLPKDLKATGEPLVPEEAAPLAVASPNALAVNPACPMLVPASPSAIPPIINPPIPSTSSMISMTTTNTLNTLMAPPSPSPSSSSSSFQRIPAHTLSRYTSEFDEIAPLGHGGFGVVVRARNRLDRQEYAIKKVRLSCLPADLQHLWPFDEPSGLDGATASPSPLPSLLHPSPPSPAVAAANTTNTNNDRSSWISSSIHRRRMSQSDGRLFREVKTLAMLSNHPNVVRYYNAWVEPAYPASNANLNHTSFPSSPLYPRDASGSLNPHASSSRRDDRDLFDGSHATTTESDHHHCRSRSHGKPVPLNHSRSDHADLNSTTSSFVDDNDDDTSSSTSSSDIDSKEHNATLYIQMQLYPCQDLRKWIRSRTHIDRSLNHHLFRQIVSGLAHIHSQNVIHRDIKPENIFLQDFHVYLGDFGLAKVVADHVILNDDEDVVDGVNVNGGGVNDTHTRDDTPPPLLSDTDIVESSINEGTYFYIAPEILDSQLCTTKSDIYSLGIILFELFSHFNTAMERAVVLDQLKTTGELPHRVCDESYDDVMDLVRVLVAKEPCMRPSASDILYMASFGCDGVLTSSASSTLTLAATSASSSFSCVSSPSIGVGCLAATTPLGMHNGVVYPSPMTLGRWSTGTMDTAISLAVSPSNGDDVSVVAHDVPTSTSMAPASEHAAGVSHSPFMYSAASGSPAVVWTAHDPDDFFTDHSSQRQDHQHQHRRVQSAAVDCVACPSCDVSVSYRGDDGHHLSHVSSASSVTKNPMSSSSSMSMKPPMLRPLHMLRPRLPLPRRGSLPNFTVPCSHVGNMLSPSSLSLGSRAVYGYAGVPGSAHVSGYTGRYPTPVLCYGMSSPSQPPIHPSSPVLPSSVSVSSQCRHDRVNPHRIGGPMSDSGNQRQQPCGYFCIGGHDVTCSCHDMRERCVGDGMDVGVGVDQKLQSQQQNHCCDGLVSVSKGLPNDGSSSTTLLSTDVGVEPSGLMRHEESATTVNIVVTEAVDEITVDCDGDGDDDEDDVVAGCRLENVSMKSVLRRSPSPLCVGWNTDYVLPTSTTSSESSDLSDLSESTSSLSPVLDYRDVLIDDDASSLVNARCDVSMDVANDCGVQDVQVDDSVSGIVTTTSDVVATNDVNDTIVKADDVAGVKLRRTSDTQTRHEIPQLVRSLAHRKVMQRWAYRQGGISQLHQRREPVCLTRLDIDCGDIESHVYHGDDGSDDDIMNHDDDEDGVDDGVHLRAPRSAPVSMPSMGLATLPPLSPELSPPSMHRHAHVYVPTSAPVTCRSPIPMQRAASLAVVPVSVTRGEYDLMSTPISVSVSDGASKLMQHHHHHREHHLRRRDVESVARDVDHASVGIVDGGDDVVGVGYRDGVSQRRHPAWGI